MRSIFILTLCSLVAQIAQPLEKYFNYGVDQEGVQLFNFFHNVQNGFYVDIGCYDSIFASNTLNLESMGWDGINIDASPARLPRFFYSRPWEPSLNYAIGDKDQYVTLYQLAEDSSSTISPKVMEFVKSYKPVRDQTKIASLSMKQLCERFFYRRPLFLNLDIEGFGSMALSSNDWKNPKCRPQVIFSQINQETKVTGLPLPEVVLKQQGYRKWPGTVGLNEIFVAEQLYDKYTQIYNEGKQLSFKKGIYNIGSIAYGFVMNVLKLSTTVVPHYEPKTDDVYYLFAKFKQPVDLFWANEFSNQISAKKNRPIIVLNYDPNDSVLLLRSSNYSSSVVNTPEMKYYNITIFKTDNTKFTVYVVDHSMTNNVPPRIIVTNVGNFQIGSTSQSSNQKQAPSLANIISQMSNSSTDSKTLARIQQLLNESFNLINKTSGNLLVRKLQLLQTLKTNHFYDKSKLQSILNELNNFDKIPKKPVANKKVTDDDKIDPSETQSKVSIALRNQVFVLFTVFFSMLIVNVVVCVAMEPTKQVKIRSPKKLRKRKSQQNENQRQGRTEEQFGQELEKQQEINQQN